ncbi:unnamed protein product [Moneuplotes crassus]|uniref:Uncharacterized protein n=1 Tax=Euplotes crassus TaxID=5936 RepID=A0AAD1XIZ1_EUPCR|nr:unnamed protein product [Moneuplotes crassus]
MIFKLIKYNKSRNKCCSPRFQKSSSTSIKLKCILLTLTPILCATEMKPSQCFCSGICHDFELQRRTDRASQDSCMCASNRALLNGNSRFRDHNNQSEKVLHQLADIKIKKLPKVFNYYQEDPDSKMQRSMSLSSHSKGFRIRKSGDKIAIPTEKEGKLSFRSILTTIIERNKRFEQQRPPIDKIRSLILGSKRARERAEKSWKDDRASFTPFVAPAPGPPQEVQGAVQKIRIRIRSKAKTPMIH